MTTSNNNELHIAFDDVGDSWQGGDLESMFDDNGDSCKRDDSKLGEKQKDHESTNNKQEERKTKRIKWTKERHDRFLKALDKIGIGESTIQFHKNSFNYNPSDDKV